MGLEGEDHSEMREEEDDDEIDDDEGSASCTTESDISAQRDRDQKIPEGFLM